MKDMKGIEGEGREMGFMDRFVEVKRRVEGACEHANREPDEVKIVVAAKTRTPEEVTEAVEAGLMFIGENRVQEAKQKVPLCSGRIEWHMIGHLQRNKVRDVVSLFSMIHSVDSLRLLEAINGVCEAEGITMPVCIEVNVSGESSKFGMVPSDVPDLLRISGGMKNVDVIGLMTMPPFTPDPEGARPFFKKLRDMRDGWQKECGVVLEELSMGMSNDFEVAIEEGATWIRIGTILFGAR